ncbi:pectate lyase-like adhesive domain-containing protein [Enterococcus sp. AZ109]|uniref:pectate lyase-like adhesive domain-containing protein n=1 Tax=Enterococcus sp. AZ109 TaxID=2774634 RepID=UPI003F683B91
MKKCITILSLFFIAATPLAPVFAETVTDSSEAQTTTATSEEGLKTESENILDNTVDQLNKDEADTTASTDEANQANSVDALNEAEQPDETEESEDLADRVGTRFAADIGHPTERPLPVDVASIEGADNVAVHEVRDRAQFEDGLKDNSRGITVIKVMKSFVIEERELRTGISNTSGRKIVIEGNGNAIDFTGQTYYFNRYADVVVQNLLVGNGNAWGIFDGFHGGDNFSVFTFHNINQVGTQIFEGWAGRVILSGDVSLNNGPTGQTNYASPVGGTIRNFSPTSIGSYTSSANIEAAQLYIKAGSNITARNGLKGGNFAITGNGNFYIEPGDFTKVTLDNDISTNVGEWSGQDYSPASIAINGAGPNSSWANNAASFGGKSSNLFYIPESAEVEIINGQSRQRDAAVLYFDNADTRAHIAGKLHMTSKGDSRGNTIDSEVPVGFAGDQSRLTLGENAEFTLDITGATGDNGNAIRMNGAGSTIELGKGSLFRVRSDTSDTRNTPNSTANGTLIYMACANYRNGSITVGDGATFDIAKTRSTNGNALMCLGRNTYYATLQAANSHAIRLWNNGNTSDTENHNWQPLSTTSIQYMGTRVNTKSTNCTHTPSLEGFNANYQTDNRQRLVIEPTSAAVLKVKHQKNKHGATEGTPEVAEILININEAIDKNFDQYQKTYAGYTYQGVASTDPDPVPDFMPAEGVTVNMNYTYDGSIKVSYPTIYDFGSHAISLDGLKITQPRVLDGGEQPAALTITDDRYETQRWSLTLAETNPLTVTLSGGATQNLAGCLYYGDLDISDAARVVESDQFTPNVETTKNITESWSDTKGLMLKVPVDKQYNGNYSGTLTWTLTAGPTSG